MIELPDKIDHFTMDGEAYSMTLQYRIEDNTTLVWIQDHKKRVFNIEVRLSNLFMDKHHDYREYLVYELNTIRKGYEAQ